MALELNNPQMPLKQKKHNQIPLLDMILNYLIVIILLDPVL